MMEMPELYLEIPLVTINACSDLCSLGIKRGWIAMDCTPMIGQMRLGESGGIIHCSPE